MQRRIAEPGNYHINDASDNNISDKCVEVLPLQFPSFLNILTFGVVSIIQRNININVLLFRVRCSFVVRS